MIIPIELRFKADKDSKSALRTEKTIKSHDVNSIEFHISIEGLELTDSHTAKILSVFHSSKSQVNVDCEIVDGKIIYKPDTNLISRHEHVTSYVYVYKGNQSLDVREFIYTVDLSKIDETSLEVKEVYDQSYADLLADFEQALSDYKDNLPQADSVRADIDEILNQFSEDSQKAIGDLNEVTTTVEVAEASRINAEQARKEAEILREDNYEQLIDTALIEADVVEKVDNKVTELTPRMNDLTAQLAQTDSYLQGELSPKKLKKGVVTFIFDGGNKSIYDHALREFNTRNLKACFSIPIENTLLSNTAGTMTYDQMRELQDEYDWEVISHGRTARAINGLDRDNAYWELAETKTVLLEHGFKVSQYLARASNFGTEHKDILMDTYDCGYLGSQAGTVVANNVNTYPIDIYNLTRYSMNAKTLDELKARVDYAEEQKGWLVFYEHEINLGGDYPSAELLGQLLDYIKSKDIEVLTGSEALSKVFTKLIGKENIERVNSDAVLSLQKSTGTNLLKNASFSGYGTPPYWDFDWGNITSPTKTIAYSKTLSIHTAIINLAGANTGADEHFELYQEIDALLPSNDYFTFAFEGSSTAYNVKYEAEITAYNGDVVVTQATKEFSSTPWYRKYQVACFIPGTGVTKIKVAIRGKQTAANNPTFFRIRKPQLNQGVSSPPFAMTSSFTEKLLARKTVGQTLQPNTSLPMYFSDTLIDEQSRFSTNNTYQLKSITGTLQVSAQLVFNATEIGKTYTVQLMVNGAEFTRSSVVSTSEGEVMVSISTLVPMTGGQVLRVHGLHNATVSQVVKEGAGTYVSAHLV